MHKNYAIFLKNIFIILYVLYCFAISHALDQIGY